MVSKHNRLQGPKIHPRIRRLLPLHSSRSRRKEGAIGILLPLPQRHQERLPRGRQRCRCGQGKGSLGTCLGENDDIPWHQQEDACGYLQRHAELQGLL